MNRARCSSRESACRKHLTEILELVKGNRLGITPTEPTVSLSIAARKSAQLRYRRDIHQSPMKSMSTSIENDFLNAVLSRQPVSSSLVYILYAKGTCWWLCRGSNPTLWILMFNVHYQVDELNSRNKRTFLLRHEQSTLV